MLQSDLCMAHLIDAWRYERHTYKLLVELQCQSACRHKQNQHQHQRIEEHTSFSGRDLRPCHHRIGRAKSVPTWEKESISIFKLRAKSLRPRANCEKMTGKPSFGDLSRKTAWPLPLHVLEPLPSVPKVPIRTSVSILTSGSGRRKIYPRQAG